MPSQALPIALVTIGVTLALGLPKFRVGLGHNLPVFARVQVPEATVHKDDCPVFWKNNIGLTGSCFDGKSESVSEGMEQSTDDNLGGSILPANARHVEAARCVWLLQCHGVLCCHS